MMKYSKEEVIEKVRKCLTLAAGTTPEEAEVAMLHAQKLMAKYHIELAEVSLEEKPSENVKGEEVPKINLARPWVRRLAEVVAKNFRCTNYLSGYGNTWRAVFCGFETDAKVAREVFSASYKYIERAGENRAQRCNDRGQSSQGVKVSFCSGFVRGLADAYEAQIRTSSEMGLMVVAPQEALDIVANLQRKKIGFNQYARQDENYHAGYQEGYAYGSKRSIEDGSGNT